MDRLIRNKLYDVIYAIHITQLEIFGKPKELSEFGLKKAPQNWCYVEDDE